jgi:hypothetical protein
MVEAAEERRPVEEGDGGGGRSGLDTRNPVGQDIVHSMLMIEGGALGSHSGELDKR